MRNISDYHFRIEDVPNVGEKVTAIYRPGDTIPTGIELEGPTARVAALLADILCDQYRMVPASCDSFARTPASYIRTA